MAIQQPNLAARFAQGVGSANALQQVRDQRADRQRASQGRNALADLLTGGQDPNAMNQLAQADPTAAMEYQQFQGEQQKAQQEAQARQAAESALTVRNALQAGDVPLAMQTLEQAPDSPQKRRALELLQQNRPEPVLQMADSRVDMLTRMGVLESESGLSSSDLVKTAGPEGQPVFTRAEEAVGERPFREQDGRQFQTVTPGQARQTPGLEALSGPIEQGLVVAQLDDRGDLKIKSVPTDDESAFEEKTRIYQEDLGLSRPEAVSLAGGNSSIKVTDAGRVLVTDEAAALRGEEGAAREIPLGEPIEIQELPRDQTIFGQSEDASGLRSGVLGITARIPGTDASRAEQQVLEARSNLRLLRERITTSLQDNPRFAIRERDQIQEALDIEPAVFDNPTALRARMAAVDQFIRQRFNFARDASDNPRLGEETRSNAAEKAEIMAQTLSQLGAPQLEEILPELDAQAIEAVPRDDLEFLVDQMSDEDIAGLSDETINAIERKLK